MKKIITKILRESNFSFVNDIDDVENNFVVGRMFYFVDDDEPRTHYVIIGRNDEVVNVSWDEEHGWGSSTMKLDYLIDEYMSDNLLFGAERVNESDGFSFVDDIGESHGLGIGDKVRVNFRGGNYGIIVIDNIYGDIVQYIILKDTEDPEMVGHYSRVKSSRVENYLENGLWEVLPQY